MMDEKRKAKVGRKLETGRTKNNPRQSVKTLASNSEHKSKSTLEKYFRIFYGEFDPGSGRTLAACLTHASRTEIKMKPSEF